MRSAEATAQVSTPVDEVFEFLADLDNHWRLASRWIEVVTLQSAGERADGATVRLSGPLGLARSVQTQVERVTQSSEIRGRGRSGRTQAEVAWTLDAVHAGTRVAVEARLLRASAADRLIWLAFGRVWLARRLRLTVAGLDEVLAALPARA